uniref:Chemosensory protein CSP19 n=1 Tax=Carposina sasakii TaxID=252295 RepID=A0A9E8LCL3_CARSA|nr:chemosensory protein CSP19 [Carposina sasakii]
MYTGCNKKDPCQIKMKFLVILSAILAVVSSEGDTYSTDNDDLDIESVVQNVEILKGFLGCFLDTDQCNNISADFKKDIPEAVMQACARCTPAQKHIFRIFLEGLMAKIPNDYHIFKNKYDPENKYFDALEAAVSQS